jgi:hypothetical protein
MKFVESPPDDGQLVQDEVRSVTIVGLSEEEGATVLRRCLPEDLRNL